jgi:hypothetical protein
MQKAAWKGGAVLENDRDASARARSRPEGHPIGRGIVDLELAWLVFGHGGAPAGCKENLNDASMEAEVVFVNPGCAA